MSSSALLGAVREFTTAIVNPYDLEELLQRLTGHACAVTGSQGAGVMLAGENGLGFAAASDDPVLEIEVLQDRIESGACHAAFTSNQLVLVDDLTAEQRWGEYRDRAVRLGFRAVAGVPMNAWGQTIGVLNIYRRTSGPWSDADVEAAEIVTAMGAAYVLHATRSQQQHTLAEQLQEALENRDAIGQAKGLLMARHDIGPDEAFAMLRSVSQNANRKLHEVARGLLEIESTPVD